MLKRSIVSAVVLSSDNYILFGKKNPKHGGVYLHKWHLPGGGVEQGEEKIAAMQRELHEETGLQVVAEIIQPFDQMGKTLTLKTLDSGEKVPCEMTFDVYKISLPMAHDQYFVEAGDDFSELLWIPVKDIAEYPLTPPSISLFLRHDWITHEQAIAQRTFRDADEEIVEFADATLSWRVSAYALIIQDGNILIIKNKKEKYYDVVGGGVEFGEIVEDALYRESLEEAGATIKLGTLVHTKVDWFFHRKLNAFFQTFQLFYLAELNGELQAPLEEDTEWVGWVPLSEIGTKYILPVTVQLALAQTQL